MSAPPISASDVSRAEARTARAAGWRRRDLWWERLQERGNRELAAGNRAAASRGFLAAWWLAVVGFSRNDPRYATSLANAGYAARLRGAERTARSRYARARRLWASVPDVIADIEIRPRARSSLFHLRMELRHRDTYEANARARLAAIASEAGAALAAIETGAAPPVRLHSRWKGEKPAQFDDRRKLLSACLLIAPDRA